MSGGDGSFLEKSLGEWIGALRLHREAPQGLLEDFPRSPELLSAALAHANAEVRLRAVFEKAAGRSPRPSLRSSQTPIRTLPGG
jgi:hypothetical protein